MNMSYLLLIILVHVILVFLVHIFCADTLEVVVRRAHFGKLVR